MESSSNKSVAMLLHLSTFSQWFFPFGNFIVPLVIWSTAKKDSDFVDRHGRQAINFQLSLLTYTLILALIAVPIAIFTVFRHVPFREWVHDNVSIRHELSPENISGIAFLAIVAVVVFVFLKIAEFFLVIFATVKASEGVAYNYPLCIPFIKADQAGAIAVIDSSSDEISRQEVTSEVASEIQNTEAQSASQEKEKPE